MSVGDELNKKSNHHNARCIKCVCEVPPTPTCVFFSNATECKLIKHPKPYVNLTERQNSGWYDFGHKRNCSENENTGGVTSSRQHNCQCNE